MRCGNCGAQLKDGARFCESCGAKVVNTTPSKKNNSQPKKSKKGGRGILLILLVAAIGAGIYMFSNLFGGGGGGGNSGGGNNPGSGGMNPTENVTPTPNSGNIDPDLDYKILSDLAEAIEPTPENSPGNPAFIELSFTEEEYETSPAYVAPISRDLPEVEFTNYGIHVNMKSYNLHNEEDRLFMEVMPQKTDPTYGYDLYTYNFWLESGQDKFGTEVEITFPIHNGKNALRNVLWHNWDTGKCEELFYTVSDDGTTCTAYIDHFSEVVVAEMNVEQLRELADKLSKIDSSIGSVFVEGLSGDLSNPLTYKVELVSTDVFEKIAYMETDNARGVFEVLKNGGGVPVNADWSETFSLWGKGADVAAAAVTVGQAVKLWGDSFSIPASGVLTALGWTLLNLRVMVMTLSGVAPQKVYEEFEWSFYLATVGTIGSGLSLYEKDLLIYAGTRITTLTISTAISWACVAIFLGTTAYSLYEKYVAPEICPFGQPMTLEDGAYHEYLKTPTTDVLEKLNINSTTPLTGRGNGWADAINAIFEANKDTMDSKQLGEKIVELYETYVNYFWEDMPMKTRRNYWRAYVDFAAAEWITQCTTAIPSNNLPSGSGEMGRLMEIFSKSDNIQTTLLGDMYAQPMSEEGFVNVWRKINFDEKYVLASKKEYKHRAMEAVAQYTNKIIYDLVKKEYHNNLLNAKNLLQNEVLPLMNTMLVFYAEDIGVEEEKKEKIIDKPSIIDFSPYYGWDPVMYWGYDRKVCKMEFIGNKTPLYRSANCATANMPDLQPKRGTPKLGKCNFYHYLQFGAPEMVAITSGNTDFPDLIGNVDPKSVIAYKADTKYGTEQGCFVPVVFNAPLELLIDEKMRIIKDSHFFEYYDDDIQMPHDVHLMVAKDSIMTITLPAIENLKIDDDIFCRSKLSLSGKVVEITKSIDASGRDYVLYKGILVGDYEFSEYFSDGDEDATITCTTDSKKYRRDGVSEKFSKFELVYFYGIGQYDMHISLALDYVKFSSSSQGIREGKADGDVETYEIWLTSKVKNKNLCNFNSDITDWK